jgi:PAS domain S-box-containing protein
MDRVWASAPMAALRVWQGPGGLQVEPNPAARAWAGAHGLGVGVWQAVVDALGPAGGGGAALTGQKAERVIARESDVDIDLDIDLPTGIALRCRWVPLPDDGAVVWITPLDTASRAAAPEPVEALRARAGLLPEAVGVGFWSRDGDTGAAHWDEQLHRIHGRPAGLGAPSLQSWIAEHVHPEDQAWMQELQDRALAAWAPITDASFRLPDRGSGERWVQSWTRRIVRDGRRLAFGMHLDITDRQRTQARLEHERDRQQFAIHAAQIGVWERGADGRVIYWNAPMYRLRGLDAGDPRPSGELLALTTHPDDLAPLLAITAQPADGTEPFRLEYRVRGADGGWRWLVTEGRTLRDAAGRVLGAAGVDVDITERKRADALLLDKQRAEQASRDKSAFMARLSHELRTPMNAVLGFARLLDDDGVEPPSERQRARLQRILDAGTQLMAMIDDVLDLASLEADEPTLPAATLAVGEVIDDVVTMLAPLAARHGQQLRVGSVPAAAWVRADRRRLVQALAHGMAQLLRDRGEPGSVRIDAVQRVTEAGTDVTFEVQVDGQPPVDLFERHAAARDTTGDSGVGTGLSLARSLAEALGGGLAAGSRAAPGFVLWLPAEPAGALPATGVSARGLTVLCVEDNPVNMLLLRELLSLRPGLNMLAAADGQSGITLGLQGRPDIALLDLQLPDLDGVDVLRRLRAEPSLARCRFVALSANAMPADIDHALACGFDEYWTKPIDFGRFLADIDRLAAQVALPGG